MMKYLIACALVASALVCLVGAELKNGPKEQLLDLGIIAGQSIKRGFKEAKPTLNSLGNSLGDMLNKFKDNEQVKKGLEFVNKNVKPAVDDAGKRMKPVFDEADKKLRPLLTEAEKKMRPYVQKVDEFVENEAIPRWKKGVSDMKENRKKIMSEHKQRQAQYKSGQESEEQT